MHMHAYAFSMVYIEFIFTDICNYIINDNVLLYISFPLDINKY